ncbi:MAG: hypothetical protein V3T23_02465 [Nitrososphaerales archaeon]
MQKEITVVLGGTLPLGKPERGKGMGHVRLSLGPPILDKSLDEIESDPDSCHALLKDWLNYDAQNIARRRVGRIAIAGPSNWQTNKLISRYGQKKHCTSLRGTIGSRRKILRRFSPHLHTTIGTTSRRRSWKRYADFWLKLRSILMTMERSSQEVS